MSYPEHNPKDMRLINHAQAAGVINTAYLSSAILCIEGPSGVGKTESTEAIIPARAAAYAAVSGNPCVVHDHMTMGGPDNAPDDTDFMVQYYIDCTNLSGNNVAGLGWVDASNPDNHRFTQSKPSLIENLQKYRDNPRCKGGMTTFDEFTNIADTRVHAALNQLFTHWRTGEFHLDFKWFNKHWQNVLLNNAPGDGASKAVMDHPISNRIDFKYRLTTTGKQLAAYLTSKGKAHPVVVHMLNKGGAFGRPFIRMPNPEQEVDTRGGVVKPNSKYHVRAVSPRRWEKISEVMFLCDADDTLDRELLLDGMTVSNDMTKEMLSVMVLLQMLPDISRVYDDPAGCAMPDDDHALQYAVLSNLVNGLAGAEGDHRAAPAIGIYIQRAEPEVQALAMRSLYTCSQDTDYDWVDKRVWQALFGNADAMRVNDIPVISESTAIRDEIFSNIQLGKATNTLEELWREAVSGETVETLDDLEVSDDSDEFGELDLENL